MRMVAAKRNGGDLALGKENMILLLLLLLMMTMMIVMISLIDIDGLHIDHDLQKVDGIGVEVLLATPIDLHLLGQVPGEDIQVAADPLVVDIPVLDHLIAIRLPHHIEDDEAHQDPGLRGVVTDIIITIVTTNTGVGAAEDLPLLSEKDRVLHLGRVDLVVGVDRVLVLIQMTIDVVSKGPAGRESSK